MEYKLSSGTSWTPAPGTAITGLSWGTYNVRFAAKPGFNPGTAANVVVPIYGNQLAEAKLIFTFDDGWQDNLIYAWPIMDAAGFKGTMYINRDIINGVGPNIMTYENLDTLYSYGWDLGNHTTNHYDNGDRTDATTLALLRSIYLDNQNWLLANNWVRGAYHACYPSGKYSDQLIEILKEIGVLTGRATDESSAGNTQTIPVSNFYKLPVQYVETEQSNLDDVKAAIKYAVDHGTTAILMIHKVQPADGNLVVTTSDFQQIVTYAKGFSDQGSLSVMTMSDWYDEVAPLSGMSSEMTFASTYIADEEPMAEPITLSSIAVKTPAAKLIYTVGDELDITGLVIEGAYSDGSIMDETVTAENVTGFDSTVEAASQALTITVGDQTTAYTVEIKAVPATLSSIAVKTPAAKTVYTVGDELDITGLTIEGTYSDGRKDENVTAQDIIGFDSSAEATGQTLTITIGGQTTFFTVDITAPKLPETISE